MPFGLLVNELATNAIKHAFPNGTGTVILSVAPVDGAFELSVADNGVGTSPEISAKKSERRGSDYVAIFVRQLGGSVVPTLAGGTGTTVTISLPLLLVARDSAPRQAA